MAAFSLFLVVSVFAASQFVSAALPLAAQRLQSPKAAWGIHPRIRVGSPRRGAQPRFTIPTFSNPKAAKYHVNSSALPLVTFPLQESWAGLLPISSRASESRKLTFWYWPTSAMGGSDTLTIWLNGGPGCSSFEGFLEENGPFRYDAGMSAPELNEYAWTTSSDVLYIEQPVGTGFTSGEPNIENESQLANEFYDFLEQFFAIFTELKFRKLFISGESYAGMYIPYIATRIIDASSAEKAALPLNLQGLLINDGVYSSFITGAAIPAARFAASHQAVMNLTDAQVSALALNARKCGYDKVLAQVTYPPTGKIPLPNGGKDVVAPGCDLDYQLWDYAQQANPCFNIYRVTDRCPTLADPIEPYFSRSDVQALIHIPNFGPWSECSNINVFKNGIDDSAYSETLLPRLLATLPRGVTLWHGLDDSILMNEGDRITIQNLTWGGLQGFQKPITTKLVLDGATVGVWHSERKLTYLEIEDAGHMIPQNQPAVALHVFKYAIGQGVL